MEFSVGGTSIYWKYVRKFGTFEHSIDFSGAIVSVERGYPEGNTFIYVKCGLPSCSLTKIDGEVRASNHDTTISCGREMNPRVLKALQLWISSHPKKNFKF
jgi:hypothetical protein